MLTQERYHTDRQKLVNRKGAVTITAIDETDTVLLNQRYEEI